MATEIKVPVLGESVSEASIIRWIKQVGEAVAVDESIVELETDKVTLEVPSPVAGVIIEHMAAEGDDVEVGALLCKIEEGAVASAAAPAAPVETAPAAPITPATTYKTPAPTSQAAQKLSPAVERQLATSNINPSQVHATGPKGNITKGDVIAAAKMSAADLHTGGEKNVGADKAAQPQTPIYEPSANPHNDTRTEERVRMSRLRKVIATRLKEAQNTAAMLTTFNEVNMTALIKLRAKYREMFEKKHGAKMGYMSFFVKAAVSALKDLPSVNAAIEGDEIVYRNYYDIGIAVGSPQGLVVPVLRDADKLSFAEIEISIAELGRRAREGTLSIADMTGGTFTITNGGVFGSLLSTPIINPPQSAILGMHKIQKRPICNDEGELVAADMMYLANSYDHRIIDGKEAVNFLVRIKESLEDPARLILDI